MSPTQLDAIVTAGGVPEPDEPLYPYTQGKSKALLDVAGKPMIQWVLDALGGAERVRRVVVVGLSGEDSISCRKTLGFVPNQGHMLNNVRAGAQWVLGQDRSAALALVVSSDIPGITSEMVDWTAETALQTDHDFYYSIVAQAVMERTFPGSNRTYTRLKDATVCGGDLNLIRLRLAAEESELWRKVIASRKSVWRQAALLGWEPLLLMLTRQLSVKRAEKLAQKRLHIRGRAILSPFAEVGMDVDKPHQLELLSAYLAARAT